MVPLNAGGGGGSREYRNPLAPGGAGASLDATPLVSSQSGGSEAFEDQEYQQWRQSLNKDASNRDSWTDRLKKPRLPFVDTAQAKDFYGTHKKKLWIGAGVFFFVILIIVIVVATKGSGGDPANEVLDDVVQNSFRAAERKAVFSEETLGEYPKIATIFTSLLNMPALELSDAQLNPQAILQDLKTTAADWFKTKLAQFPLLPDGITRTLCGQAEGVAGMERTHCCLTFMLDGEFGAKLKQAKFDREHVDGFLTCDLAGDWNIVAGLEQMGVSVGGDRTWVHDVTLRSEGKLVVSSNNFLYEGLQVEKGISVFADASIAQVPEPTRIVAATFLTKPLDAITFGFQGIFPLDALDRVNFAAARLAVAADVRDVRFGRFVQLERFRFGLVRAAGGALGTDVYAHMRVLDAGGRAVIGVRATARFEQYHGLDFAGELDDGTWTLIPGHEAWGKLEGGRVTARLTKAPELRAEFVSFAGVGTFGFGDQGREASIALSGEVEVDAARAVDVCVLAKTRLSDGVGLFASLTKLPPAALSNLVSLTAADVTMTLCTSDRANFKGLPVRRGLGVTLAEAPLGRHVSADVTQDLTKLSGEVAAFPWRVSFFMPVFDSGARAFTLQLSQTRGVLITRALELQRLRFFMEVRDAGVQEVRLAATARVALPADSVLAFSVVGSYARATQTYELSGALDEPWTRPFGLPAVTADKATARLTKAPGRTDVRIDAQFTLTFTSPDSRVQLAGVLQLRDGDSPRYHVGTAAPVEIGPLVPRAVKPVVDLRGGVGVMMSNYAFADPATGYAIKRGLNFYSKDLRVTVADSEVLRNLQTLLGTNIPEEIPDVFLVLPVGGGSPQAGRIRPLGARRRAISLPPFDLAVSLPDLSLLGGVAVFKGTKLNARLTETGEYAFKMVSQLEVTIHGSSFSLTAQARVTNTVKQVTFSANIPSWKSPFGLDWISLGASQLTASFGTERRALSLATSLFFNPGQGIPPVNLALTAVIQDGGGYFGLAGLRADLIMDLAIYAINTVIKVPDPAWLYKEMETTSMAFFFSTLQRAWTNGRGRRYEMSRGLNFFVDTGRERKDCRAMSPELAGRDSHCEHAVMSAVKEILPSAYRTAMYRFGTVLPIFVDVLGGRRRGRRALDPLKVFLEHTGEIPFSDSLSLVSVKLTASIDIGLRKRRRSSSSSNPFAAPARRRAGAGREQQLGHARVDADGDEAGFWDEVAAAMPSPGRAVPRAEAMEAAAKRSRVRRAFSVTGELAAQLKLKIDGTSTIFFEVAGLVIVDTKGIAARVEGTMYGDPWRNAFGIPGLSLHGATVGIGFGPICPPCLYYLKFGTVITFGDKRIALQGAYDMNASPLPGGYLKASYTGPWLTLMDLFAFLNVLKADTIDMSKVPGWIASLLGIKDLRVELATADMTIPDLTALSVDNGVEYGSVPDVTIKAGFRFEGMLRLLGVDIWVKIGVRYGLAVLPGFSMSLGFDFAAINRHVDWFMDQLRKASDIPIIGDILNLDEVKYVMTFRIDRISMNDFDTTQLLRGNLPALVVDWQIEGQKRKLTLPTVRLDLDLLSMLAEAIGFPACVVNAQCSGSQVCNHKGNWAWFCVPHCPGDTFSFASLGCFPDTLKKAFQDFGKAVKDGFEDFGGMIKDGFDDIFGRDLQHVLELEHAARLRRAGITALHSLPSQPNHAAARYSAEAVAPAA